MHWNTVPIVNFTVIRQFITQFWLILNIHRELQFVSAIELWSLVLFAHSLLYTVITHIPLSYIFY